MKLTQSKHIKMLKVKSGRERQSKSIIQLKRLENKKLLKKYQMLQIDTSIT